MRATVMHAAGDVRIEEVPDPQLVETTDAILRVTRACICGSDLWPYASLEASEHGQRMGHESIGVVEEVGPEVRSVKPGDFVIMPFASSDGSCEFCAEGLNTACRHVGFFGNGGDMDGARGGGAPPPPPRRPSLRRPGGGGGPPPPRSPPLSRGGGPRPPPPRRP